VAHLAHAVGQVFVLLLGFRKVSSKRLQQLVDLRRSSLQGAKKDLLKDAEIGNVGANACG